MQAGGLFVSLVDLPGAYSLEAQSADEKVVVDYLSGRMPGSSRPDAIICVVDAGNLLRNLYLVSQVAELGIPAVIALNMFDEARANGKNIDCALLGERLGAAVVPTVAAKGEGVQELKEALSAVLAAPRPMRRVEWPAPVNEGVSLLRKAPELADAEQRCLLHLLFSAPLPEALQQERMSGRLAEARKPLLDAGIEPLQCEAVLRYDWLRGLVAGAVVSAAGKEHSAQITDRVDNVLSHRIFGLLIFLAAMFVVFQSIYALAAPLMDAIDSLFEALSAAAAGPLAAAPVLKSLVTDGIIPGVGSVVVFLPQILILFLFIAVLEDSGYMARAAFLMDRLFSWCGLSGKSFVPMLSSYACAVPGVMAARTIDEPKARLITTLTAPLMSCSARLPVYVLLIGAFIEPVYGPRWAACALFAVHFLGLAVAIPAAYVLNRWVLRGAGSPFVLEMPPYRMPRLRDIAWRLYERGGAFVARAGTVILSVSIVIWALSFFPHPSGLPPQVREDFAAEVSIARGVSAQQALELVDGELRGDLDARIAAAYLEQSFLGRIGKSMQPLFAPAGFDWKITVGILASFPARELIITTLGILYNLGGDVDAQSSDLFAEMRGAVWPDGSPVFTPLVAAALMVFVALCMQCGATVVTLGRESGWRWALAAFVYMTALAWCAAVLVYQCGRLLAWG